MKKHAGAILVLFSIFLVSIIFVAEETLPGQRLYPFKRVVNERLWSFVKVDKKGSLYWKFELLERRLQDAVDMILEEKLNEKEAEYIGNEILSVSFDIDKSISEIEEKEGAMKALKPRTTHEIIARAYNAAISQMVEDDRSIEGFQYIKSALYEITTKSVSARGELEGELIRDESLMTIENIKALSDNVETRMNVNRKLVDKSAEFADSKTHSYILKRYAAAERLQKVAKQAIENEDYVGAFAFLQKAYRVSEEVGLFVVIQDRMKKPSSNKPVSQSESQMSVGENGRTEDMDNPKESDSEPESNNNQGLKPSIDSIRENKTIERSSMN